MFFQISFFLVFVIGEDELFILEQIASCKVYLVKVFTTSVLNCYNPIPWCWNVLLYLKELMAQELLPN